MKDKLIIQLTDRGTKASAEVARAVIKEPSKVALLFESIVSTKAKIKYGSARSLLIISENKPELIYPDFGFFIDLISGSNNILKWAAIDIISNFSFCDSENKVDKKLLNSFFRMIKEDSLITAGHVVGNIWKMAINDIYPPDKIANELLTAENNNISEECNNILAGHILDSFTKFYDLLNNTKKNEVLVYAEKLTTCHRSGTKRKANMFCKRFAAVNIGN